MTMARINRRRQTIYWPAQPDERLLSMSGYQSRRVSVAVRTDRAGTQGLLDQVREAVWSVSATLPLAQVRTLDEVYGQSMARTSFTLVMLAIAGSDGAAAGRLRYLRRGRLRRLAAAARNRHPAGAWRAGGRHPAPVRAARPGAGGHWRWRSAWAAPRASHG